MAVYVDDMHMPFTIGRLRANWSHMMADTDEELHKFAKNIGLKREWFQTRPGLPWHNHYDVTDAKREMAIRHGAIEVTCFELAEFWLAKKRKVERINRMMDERRKVKVKK